MEGLPEMPAAKMTSPAETISIDKLHPDGALVCNDKRLF